MILSSLFAFSDGVREPIWYMEVLSVFKGRYI